MCTQASSQHCTRMTSCTDSNMYVLYLVLLEYTVAVHQRGPGAHARNDLHASANRVESCRPSFAALLIISVLSALKRAGYCSGLRKNGT